MRVTKKKDQFISAKIIRKQNARDHLANERTFLAWLRTSIGIMAFGFVVVKFSLFIKQISVLLGKNTVPTQGGYSQIIGVLLVTTGVILLFLSYLRYKKTEKQLTSESYASSSKLIAVLTFFIL